MTIRTHVKAGGEQIDRLAANHSEALQVRSAIKAGGWSNNHNELLKVRSALKAGGLTPNHNEALQVRSAVKAGGVNLNHCEALQVRSAIKAGGRYLNHNEALRVGSTPPIAMLRQPRTTSRKGDRLELLVIRAGLRAGRRESGRSRR